LEWAGRGELTAVSCVRLHFSAVIARHSSLNVCDPVVVKAAFAAFLVECLGVFGR
jgi:hypothetical protein